MSQRRLAQALLLGVVLVWGSTFVLVKGALGDASPLVFNLLRMTLATAALLAVNRRALRQVTRVQFAAGALAGLFLAAGYQLQTLGLARTTPAKSAFLTGLVVVFVPGLLALVPRLRPAQVARPGWRAAGGAGLAFAGLLLLTTPAGTTPASFSLASGDLLTLGCALAFALHLITLAHVSPQMPAGVLATLQIGFATVVMLLTVRAEPMRLHPTLRLLAALLVCSLLATAAAFTIQSFAQQHLPPAQTAVLLTLEPVFAALTAWLVLGTALDGRGWAGAALILAGMAAIELAPGAAPAELPA